ncbi:TauD/TfdA family dioxygenase [Phenylobacterium sp.]|uniref:TauD/TfdA family dioxygenase n=1 Tax=Phenylobacterium sp. TaxID=1871053 RepID=UPI00262A1AA8|nr:TauD/TfdA family dioxygenase [Phenylobacterium sp.]
MSSDAPAAPVAPPAELTTPDVWRGPDLAGSAAWRYALSPAEVDELLRAREAPAGKDMSAWTRADFPLPTLGPKIEGWLDELDRGRGFVLIRGFPVEAHDERTCTEIYWGVGLHMGRAVPQNTDGDLVGHIRDVGADPNAYGVRLYKTRAEQDFHTDGADIIGLFCLHAAKSGGVSRIVSSPAIFNRMVAERPDLVPVLFQSFPFDTQGQQKPGAKPWFDLPLCRMSEGRMRMFFIPWYIRESQQHPECPRLAPAQLEAVEFIERTANDPGLYLDMDFQPGDMQFLKNAAILHKRTAYEDWPEPERKCHLLRLWLVQESFSAGEEMLRKGIRQEA